MKNILTVLVMVLLFSAGNTFAQDTLRTRSQDQDNYQNKEQKKKQLNQKAQVQKQQRTNRTVEEDMQGSTLQRSSEKTGFVDVDGDGVNDNTLDADGDGIPNGQDPDYVRPQDGSGQMKRIGEKENKGSGLGSEDGTGTQQKSKQGGKK